MHRLVKSTTSIGITEVVLLVVALIKNKFLALTIGAEGFGIFGILNSFFNVLGVLAGGWLGIGLTRFLSYYKSIDSKKYTNELVSFSLTLSLTISVSVVIFILIFRQGILEYFFENQVKNQIFILFSISFIGNSIRPLIVNVFQGLMLIKSVVNLRFFITFIEVITIILLVFYFDLNGFFIAILVSSIVFLIYSIYLIFKNNINLKLRYKVSDNVKDKLLNFGYVNLSLSLLNLAAIYVQTKMITSYLGLGLVGIYWAGNTIRLYSDIPGKSAGFSFLPRMSEKMLDLDRNRELNMFLFVTFMIYSIVGAIIIEFSPLIVNLLFSNEFSILQKLLPVFVLAELLHNLERPFVHATLGIDELKVHSFSVITSSIMWILIPYIFVDYVGLAAFPLGVCIGQFLAFLIYYNNLRYKLGFSLDTRNVVVIAMNILVYSAVIYFDWNFSAIVFVSMIALNFVLLSKSEMRSLYLRGKVLLGK